MTKVSCIQHFFVTKFHHPSENFERKKRQPNNEHCKQLYNLFRNRVNRELKRSKKTYFTDFFQENEYYGWKERAKNGDPPSFRKS